MIVSAQNVFVGHCSACGAAIVVTRDHGEAWPRVECPPCGQAYSLGGLDNGLCYGSNWQVRD